jgi:hypothetical protein
MNSMNKFQALWNQSFFISTTKTHLPGVVVVTAGIIDSHRAPVYSGGQSQYRTFPFTRHTPPDRQYPLAQVTSKHQMTFIHK